MILTLKAHQFTVDTFFYTKTQDDKRKPPMFINMECILIWNVILYYFLNRVSHQVWSPPIRQEWLGCKSQESPDLFCPSTGVSRMPRSMQLLCVCYVSILDFNVFMARPNSVLFLLSTERGNNFPVYSLSSAPAVFHVCERIILVSLTKYWAFGTCYQQLLNICYLIVRSFTRFSWKMFVLPWR